MATQVLSPAQANLKMVLWHTEAESMRSSDLYVWLSDSGLSSEVALKLRELATYTKKVGSKVFAVGKVILIKIIEFVKAHPHLVMGAGIGAAISAAVCSLITSIPFLGPILAPVAAVLGIVITVTGAVAGHRLDKRAQGKVVSNGVIGLAEDVIEIARDFFQMIINVFNILFRGVVTA